MFEVMVDGKPVKADVTFYTSVLYEAEFREDLISDFYGVQDMKPVFETRKGKGKGETVVKVDFTKVPWSAMTKAFWAAAKTADESVPSYGEFMKGVKGVDTWELRGQLDEAISDCFFRSEAAETDA